MTAALRPPLVALGLLFCLAYVPDAGHGFIKDDFQWIIDAGQPVRTMFLSTNGFYRPLVTLSVRADYELFGLDSYPYGLTNLVLAAACAVLVFWLARSFGLSAGAAAFAGAAWAFNFHGVNMSILWISGRTALLLTSFALLSGIALLKGRRVACLLCVTAALFSKEEAVFLPAALLLWSVILSNRASLRQRWVAALEQTWWLAFPLLLYAAARLQTDAMTPFDAPEHYAFTFAPAAVARNVAEYFDRSWTFPLAGLALLWCVGRPAGGIDTRRRQVALSGIAWFACGLALTLFLPVRSSLYACWPSTGVALGGAAVADAWFERMPPRRIRRAVATAVLVLAALLPVYKLRNERWVEIADLSAQTMAALERCAGVRCDAVVLEDDPRIRRNFVNAFGSFATGARLFLGREVATDIVAAPADDAPHTAADSCVLYIRLIDGVPQPALGGACN